MDAAAGQYAVGVVKVWHAELGWGGVSASDAPGDVWVHFSDIDAPGYRSLAEGEAVEFRWVAIKHEDDECGSWPNSATWVRRLSSPPASR